MTAGRIFQDTRTALPVWFRAMPEAHLNGSPHIVSNGLLAEQPDGCQRKRQRRKHRFRSAIRRFIDVGVELFEDLKPPRVYRG